MSEPSSYQALQDNNPNAALGRAVAYLMTKPNFEDLKFGAWSKILTGQVNRNHYFFVVHDQAVVGFAGWALTDKHKALAWLNDNKPLSFQDSRDGDSMVINAWAADNGSINRFILKTLRQKAVDRNVYAKRFYKNGATRIVNLNANPFIQSHLDADGKLASV